MELLSHRLRGNKEESNQITPFLPRKLPGPIGFNVLVPDYFGEKSVGKATDQGQVCSSHTSVKCTEMFIEFLQ